MPLQGLQLLDALLKYGSERVVDDARDHVFRVRTLTDFTHYDGGKDVALVIREKAKQLVELLQDTNKLRDERKKARELAGKYVGITSAGGMSSVGNSSSYSSYNPSPHLSGELPPGFKPAYHFDDDTEPGGAGAWGNRGSGGSGSGAGSGGGGRQQERRFSGDGDSSAGGSGSGAAAGRGRGRRPGAAPAPAPAAFATAGEEDFDAFGSAPSSSAGGEVHSTTLDDFAAFSAAPTPAPAPAPAAAPRVNLSLKPAPGMAAPVLRGPGAGAAAPAPAPAASSGLDGFDPFTAAPAPAPATAHSSAADLDFFGAPVSAPAPAPAPAAAFDPFSMPAAAPAASTSATGSGFGGGLNPFAPGAHGSGGDGFGAFSAAPTAATAAAVALKPRDEDVERLVGLGGLSLMDSGA